MQRAFNFLDCGGKRSATPLYVANQGPVAAALCQRSPRLLQVSFYRIKEG
jgi:hypothetical protein